MDSEEIIEIILKYNLEVKIEERDCCNGEWKTPYNIDYFVYDNNGV